MSDAIALVLIDLQTGAFDGLRIPPVNGPEVLLRNVGALLQAARASKVPVLHIQHCAGAGEVFAEGAPGWPIFGPVAPLERESIVRKRASDAFQGTDLHDRLREIGARRLIVAGLQTEHCVAATCRGALRSGYTVHLAEDAHSTWPDKGQPAGEIMAAETTALNAEGVTLSSTDSLIELIQSRRE